MDEPDIEESDFETRTRWVVETGEDVVRIRQEESETPSGITFVKGDDGDWEMWEQNVTPEAREKDVNVPLDMIEPILEESSSRVQLWLRLGKWLSAATDCRTPWAEDDELLNESD